MQLEEKGKDPLQEALKDLLSSSAPEPPPALEDATHSITRGAEAPDSDRPPASGAALANGPRSGHAQPDYVVEIIPPPSNAAPPATESKRKWGRKRNEAPPSGAEEASEVELEGIVQVQVLPPTIHSRLALFEQAIKGQKGVRWMGTLGKINLGATLVLQLDTPTTLGRLFRGPATVDKAELLRSGKEWHVKVWLPSTDSHGSVAEAPLAGVSPSPQAPAKPKLGEEAPLDVYPESVGPSTPGQIDLEASPIASLDALNRFEKLLTSLSPGCRIANVLSMDGVCTVLIRLDGIDSETILRRLPLQIKDVEIEVTPDRITAKLPEKW